MAEKLRFCTVALDDKHIQISILDMRPTHILRAQVTLMIYDQKWRMVFQAL
jgi:hypothetical protein